MTTQTTLTIGNKSYFYYPCPTCPGENCLGHEAAIKPVLAASGWLCSRCGASNAPWINKCDCYPPTTTTNAIKTYNYDENGNVTGFAAVDMTAFERQMNPPELIPAFHLKIDVPEDGDDGRNR